jgi:hypothetical protein
MTELSFGPTLSKNLPVLIDAYNEAKYCVHCICDDDYIEYTMSRE